MNLSELIYVLVVGAILAKPTAYLGGRLGVFIGYSLDYFPSVSRWLYKNAIYIFITLFILAMFWDYDYQLLIFTVFGSVGLIRLIDLWFFS